MLTRLDTDRLHYIRSLSSETDVLTEIVEMYVKDTPLRIEALRTAAEQTDAAAVQAAAHGLKGSSANLGVPRMTELSSAIEIAAKTGQLDGLSAHIDDLAAEFESSRVALLSFMRAL
ncbi:MAG: Hpt domain-containing protein [Actinomycetota bacterium]|nr:Hpt domain-containing protein [Actinomycetota bacterium]